MTAPATAPVATSAASRGGASRTTGFAWYVAFVLALAQIVSVMDRYLLSVVLEDVKSDLVLTDTQLGILQGPAFVMLFVAAGIPLGRLADSASRKWIIAAGITVWSLATVASGFADSFEHLLAARLVVGLGEAALVPAAVSLIVAYFTPDKLTRGMSIFTAGSSLGRAVGFAGGGLVLAATGVGGALHPVAVQAGFEPWQSVFLTGGVAGLLVAVLVAFTLKEPPRSAAVRAGAGFRPAGRHFFSGLWGYLSIFMSFSTASGIVLMLGAWSISFYVREHGLTAPEAAALIGTTVLFCGPVGHLFGGWLNDWLGQKGVTSVQPKLLAAINLTLPVLIVAFTNAPDVRTAATIFGITYLVGAVSGPTSYAGAQKPTPDAYRGVISAIFLCFYTLIGAGVGPLLVGLLGDALKAQGLGLGAALALATTVFALPGLCFAWFGRHAFERIKVANQPDA